MADRDVVDRRRWLGPVLEAVVAFAAAIVFLLLCTSIHITATTRTAQVSGLASLQIRFLAIVVPLLVLMFVMARVRGGVWFAMTTRLSCAALAGVASAFVAGGVMVALHGTPYCLNAHYGDAEVIGMWANAIRDGDVALYPPKIYPPLFPHGLSWYMQVVDLPALYALKHLQIGMTAIVGPLAYLAWRTLLRPAWALGIGVVAALVIIDAYKPYENLTLALLVPLAIKFLCMLRRADERTIGQLLKAGVLFGVAFGVLCLMYSGWFKWSAPGALVAAAIVFPYRDGRWKSGLLLGGVTLVVFAIAIHGYLVDVHPHVTQAITGGAPVIHDDYVYFDALVDPAYFAMWKVDLPGLTTIWPPPGELGGLGVFTVLLFVGFGTAIAMGRQRTVVIGLGTIFAGVWVMRFWYAHNMAQTKLVQLYPRTSIEIIYILIAMAGFAIYYVVEHVARRTQNSMLRSPSAMIGVTCAFAMFIGTAGSSIADRYMAFDSLPRTTGIFAWIAHDATVRHLPPDPP